MPEAIFPKRRDDGSFAVAAIFSVSDDAVVRLVGDYATRWVRANQTWTRIWRADSIEEERLEFLNDFASEPRLESKVGQLAFTFTGRPGSKRWKDWLVRFVDELTKVFAEVQFQGFESI
jgi:hypothetical protein